MAQNGPLGLDEEVVLLSLGLGWARAVHFTLLSEDYLVSDKLFALIGDEMVDFRKELMS